MSGTDVLNKLIRLVTSRKFLALAVGLVATYTADADPTTTTLIYAGLLVAYIIGTAYEDAHNGTNNLEIVLEGVLDALDEEPPLPERGTNDG